MPFSINTHLINNTISIMQVLMPKASIRFPYTVTQAPDGIQRWKCSLVVNSKDRFTDYIRNPDEIHACVSGLVYSLLDYLISSGTPLVEELLLGNEDETLSECQAYSLQNFIELTVIPTGIDNFIPMESFWCGMYNNPKRIFVNENTKVFIGDLLYQYKECETNKPIPDNVVAFKIVK
jgi:hypothetical protein